MNGRYVREKPSSRFHSAWLIRLVRSTRSKSTRTDVYTCALVAFERTMCSAVRRRMLSNGTISSGPGAASSGSTAAGAGAGGAGEAGGGGGGAGGGRRGGGGGGRGGGAARGGVEERAGGTIGVR